MYFGFKKEFFLIRIIITAGPTIERIDPIRFISNRSTGYMGYKIAELASKRNHFVTLISGPCNITAPKVHKFIGIETADELLEAIKKELKHSDCLIMCAAVADFGVKKVSKEKIKRKHPVCLKLVPNKDLLKTLSKYKGKSLFVGFSLETQNLIKRSIKKLKEKNLDIIVANQLDKKHNIFGDNKLNAFIIDKEGCIEAIRDKEKAFIALVLLDKIEKLWYLNEAMTLRST